MEEKNDYIPLFCRDNKSVSRKKKERYLRRKMYCVRARFQFQNRLRKEDYILWMYILIWVLENPSYAFVNNPPKKKIYTYIYTRNKKFLNKSTVYLYFLDFLHSFYLFDTFVSRVIVMRLKSLRPVLYCAIACCCTIVCIA